MHSASCLWLSPFDTAARTNPHGNLWLDHRYAIALDDRAYIDEQFKMRERWVSLPGGASDPAYPALKDIIKSCLRFLPGDRPTFVEVLNTIRSQRPPGRQDITQLANFPLADWVGDFMVGRPYQREDFDAALASVRRNLRRDGHEPVEG